MSQKKVEAYKEDKKNKKEVIRKEKAKKRLGTLIALNEECRLKAKYVRGLKISL